MAWQNVSKDFQSPTGQDVNPDLDIERKTASFSVERLTNILDGGAENTEIRRKVGKYAYMKELSILWLDLPQSLLHASFAS